MATILKLSGKMRVVDLKAKRSDEPKFSYVVFELEAQPGAYAVEAWADGDLMTSRKIVHTGTKASCLAYLTNAL